MNLHDRRALKNAARSSLAKAQYNPRKIIFLHTSVTVSASLIASLLNLFLSTQIQNTGGLGGLQARSVLSTTQSVLQLAILILTPFWEAGYCWASLKIARNESSSPDSLLEGFRRFWPLFRAQLLQYLIYAGVAMICFFFSSQLFMMTPLAEPLYALIETLSSDVSLALDDAMISAIMDAYIPMLLLFMGIFLIALLVISYRFRLVTYLLLDHPDMKARTALRSSQQLLRGHKSALFRLDLSFLWFYVLQILASMLAYCDYLLPLFGVSLPVSDNVAFVLSLLLSLVGMAGLYIWSRNRLSVTYAHFYCGCVHRDAT